MKVRVTHLKAPWPEGTEVGAVVDVGASVPAWAVGKCVELADEPATEPEAEAKAAKTKGK